MLAGGRLACFRVAGEQEGLANTSCEMSLYSPMVYDEFVSGKYVALQICDDEDVETMLESFQQQNQMSVFELYIEKDVAGDSMFHSANSLTSCGNNLSNNEAQPPTNVSNLRGDEDDDDYLVSNSYVEESLDEDDSVDGISNTDNEVTNMIQPVYNELKIHFGMMLCIITISTGVILMRKTFVVWRCHQLLMLDKNYMLAWILILKIR
ncbi:hypothetical protein GmHk_18G051532 [Glycine max]|nr:hypothetical protein GmHk_18G051532 [Glycine max]